MGCKEIKQHKFEKKVSLFARIQLFFILILLVPFSESCVSYHRCALYPGDVQFGREHLLRGKYAGVLFYRPLSSSDEIQCPLIVHFKDKSMRVTEWTLEDLEKLGGVVGAGWSAREGDFQYWHLIESDYFIHFYFKNGKVFRFTFGILPHARQHTLSDVMISFNEGQPVFLPLSENEMLKYFGKPKMEICISK